MFASVLHNFTCFIDGQGKLGTGDTCKMPKLETIKEDHIGGGMTGKVEIPFLAHDILKAEAHFIDVSKDHYETFGFGPLKPVTFQFRGRITNQDASGFTSQVWFMRGYCDVEPEEWKVAAKTGLTLPITAHYLHITDGDKSILRLDPRKGIWEVNGKPVDGSYGGILRV